MGAQETRWEADARYQGVRDAAYLVTTSSYRTVAREAGIEIEAIPSIRPIDDDAYAFWVTRWINTPPPAGHGGNFRWDRIIPWVRTYTDRFEAAIWHKDTLCGLVAGKASYGPDNVTIHYLERFWGENPLQGAIAGIAFDVADNYAKVLGKSRVKLKNPLAGAIPHYQTHGFRIAEPIKANIYYAREVE